MDTRSEQELVNVHPALVAVVRLAATKAPFEVICGLRTVDQESACKAGGASETMHSRHLPNPNAAGLACAVDVAALDAAGAVSWDAELYGTINAAMQGAAAVQDIPVEWGGDWKTLKDFGHFQLPWSKYP